MSFLALVQLDGGGGGGGDMDNNNNSEGYLKPKWWVGVTTAAWRECTLREGRLQV